MARRTSSGCWAEASASAASTATVPASRRRSSTSAATSPSPPTTVPALAVILERHLRLGDHQLAAIFSSGDITGREKTLIGLDEKEIGRRIDDAQRSVTEQPVALTTQIAREKGVETPPLCARS